MNPENPTGLVLTEQAIGEICRFAVDHHLIVFADEVYQKNIFSATKKFTSFRKVRDLLPAPYNELELLSFHSTSKGLYGECGLRGGYLEMAGIGQDLYD